MKNASLVLNAVLLIAVAFLFYLHFSSKKRTEQVKGTTANEGSTEMPKGEFRIAYFELDSLNNSFAMVKDVKAELGKEEERINNELARLQRRYNDRLVQLQNSQEANSQVQSEDLQREVYKLQNEFASEKQGMNQKLQDMYMRRMQQVKTEVENFLKEYNKTRGFTYIFAYEPGFMFYRDSAYNVTSDLIKGLNAQYKKK